MEASDSWLDGLHGGRVRGELVVARHGGSGFGGDCITGLEDRVKAAATWHIAKRPAVPAFNSPTVIPLEAIEYEGLSVRSLDNFERGSDPQPSWSGPARS